MKRITLIISLLLTLSSNALLANESPTKTDGTSVYVDGKLVTQITVKRINGRLILSHSEFKSIPPQKKWYSVVIKNAKGVTLSFQNWQNNFEGKQIILSTVDNKQHAGLYKSGSNKPLYYQEDSKVIFIETKPLVLKQPKKLPLPDLFVTQGKQSTRLEYKHLGKTGQHGWQLEYILSTLNKGSKRNKTPINQFQLTCSASSKKLSLPRSFARSTYLKVNQRHQWRAVVLDDKHKAKKNWKKCRQLTNISLN